MRIWVYVAIENAIKEATKRHKHLINEFETALMMLRTAIDMKEGTAIDKMEPKECEIPEALLIDINLNNVDDMIAASFSPTFPSIEYLLKEHGLFDSFTQLMKKKSNGAYAVSNITPEELCELAAIGDLETIKQRDMSRELVDTIITSRKNTGPELYLGRYNALMIAVAHRHRPVVQYLIEKMGAKLDIKGGRRNDVSVLDCAGQPGNAYLFYTSSFFPPVDADLQNYLRDKLCLAVKRSYRDVLSTEFVGRSLLSAI